MSGFQTKEEMLQQFAKECRKKGKITKWLNAMKQNSCIIRTPEGRELLAKQGWSLVGYKQ